MSSKKNRHLEVNTIPIRHQMNRGELQRRIARRRRILALIVVLLVLVAAGAGYAYYKWNGGFGFGNTAFGNAVEADSAAGNATDAGAEAEATEVGVSSDGTADGSGDGVTAGGSETSGGSGSVASGSGTASGSGATGGSSAEATSTGASADLDAGMIFNTQKNELGTYRGGTEGDQTGKEARLMKYPDYYVDSSYPWSFVLRCTDEKVREQAVANAVAAAENDHIGYDSGDLRMTLWDQVVANDYDFSKISVDCSANCVTSALIFYKAAGYQLGIEELQNIDISIHVWDVNETLLATGLFEQKDDAGYLHTSDHGVAGDLYVAETRHVMMQVSDGVEPW